ncbi:hypothetical protein [Herbidospora daliensis]|uniref:hypothetical protein n=1 Tax=Herbidospora daliensis TaxID=295585 RepID=UPI00078162FB|nr:hypothetical protein [Herbidospora daliensis]
MAAKRRFHVVGPHAVDGVPPGRTVTLDPDVVDVDALVEAGHIAVKAPAAPQSETEPKEGDE